MNHIRQNVGRRLHGRYFIAPDLIGGIKNHGLVIAAGIFQVELYLNCLGHSSIKNSFRVRVWPEPDLHIFGPNAFCRGTQAELRTEEFVSYQWSTGEQSQSINIKQPGTYFLRVTDSLGCMADAQKEINLFPEIRGRIVSEPAKNPNSCKLFFVPEVTLGPLLYFWSNNYKDIYKNFKICHF